MQPTQQDGTTRELPGVLRQGDENALGDVFRQVRIAEDPQSGGIDEINVALHQIGKRSLGAAFDVIAQELLVRQIVHR